MSVVVILDLHQCLGTLKHSKMMNKRGQEKNNNENDRKTETFII